MRTLLQRLGSWSQWAAFSTTAEAVKRAKALRPKVARPKASKNKKEKRRILEREKSRAKTAFDRSWGEHLALSAPCEKVECMTVCPISG